MDFDRNSMTVPVQSSDYTKKSLQKDSNPTTMEVVTQTNAVKSPTDSPATTKLVYTVEEIARMLAISLRSAYNLCNSTTEFRVLRGRWKHPCTEGQLRCVAQPGSLIRRQQYGIYYKTRQLLQRPLHLRR